MEKWDAYYQYFSGIDSSLLGTTMHVPNSSKHNAHMFYLVCSSLSRRTDFIAHMRSCGIGCVFHYVPLHSSPAGSRFGKVLGHMDNTIRAGDCLVRFPMGPYVDTQYVVEATSNYLG